MKRWLAVFILPLLLGAAGPVPLVTGAVRDQDGRPIARALVTAGPAQTRTDADGTFALAAETSSVRIACDFCRPLKVTVSSDGTVAAVVQRYHAVAEQTPSSADLAGLPYGHVEAALALQPFVVLLDTKRAMPGPQLSAYGFDRFGGGVVVNGLPSYDIAAGGSSLRSIPSFGAVGMSADTIGGSAQYGDLSGAGIFALQTQSANRASGDAIAGSQRAVRFSSNASNYAATLAGSSDYSDLRARADASVQLPIGNDMLQAAVSGWSDRYTGEDYGSVDESETAFRAHYTRDRAQHFYADAFADRAGYDARTPSAIAVTGLWSDLGVQAGISSNTPVTMFADAGARWSSGLYSIQSLYVPRTAGAVRQAHVDAGVQSFAGPLQWRAAIGAFDADYSGGTYGVSTPMHATILAPEISIGYDLGSQWRIDAAASQSFRLPVLTEAYTYGAQPGALPYDRFSSQQATLTYTDRQRIRAGLSVLRSYVSNLDNGSVTCAGAFVSWQIAPALAVRAWTLHFDDTSQPVMPVYRYALTPLPATPASLWFAYRNAGGLGADLIWRRDLLDYRADVHADASVNGPLTGTLRWFIGTERRAGARITSIGIRF